MKAILFMLLMSCGLEPSEKEKIIVRDTNPPAQVPGSGGSVGSSNWDLVKPIIDEQCALAGCHAGAPFLQSERAFKASSQSRALIANGRMPLRNSPNYALYNQTKKNALLAFFNQ